MAQLYYYYSRLLWGIILTANSFLIQDTFGHNTEPCPQGWSSYNTDESSPVFCVWLSTSDVRSLDQAHQACVDKNASLIVIDSNKKFDYFKGLADNKGIAMWIGLKRSDGVVKWLTKDGLIPATNLPSELQQYHWGSYYDYNHRDGLIYESGSFSSANRYSTARYVCEQQPACKKGWFGPLCDRECHCHGENCSSFPGNPILCPYGCQVGWMGANCSQKKEDADVNYFCVNSPDQGKYAHILINTKGVNYESIHAVDSDGKWDPWCGNTHLRTYEEQSLESIKIYVGDSNHSHDGLNQSYCQKNAERGLFERRIRIQEKKGLVSRNDIEVNVECNFEDADDLSISRTTTLKREKWFRRSDVRKPIEYLDEERESVELKVRDPFTGLPVTQTEIGTSVILKIRFGQAEGNMATGVFPYDCYASGSNGESKAPFLDENGCHVAGTPVSGFSRNGSTSLITKPFPLFGFDGATGLEFHCSYTLCFGDDDCTKDCYHVMDAVNATRHRRSAGQTVHRIRGHVELGLAAAADDGDDDGVDVEKGDQDAPMDSEIDNGTGTVTWYLLVHLLSMATSLVFHG